VLSVGGVAAAVTGNPLSPVESVAHTVANVFGHGPSSHASDRAKLEASLHDVDALIRAGRLADAQALLAQLQTQSAGLSSQDRTGLQHQLAALQARLDRAVAASTKATAPGQTRAANPNRPTVKPSTGHSPAPVNSSGGNHTAVTPTSVPTLTPPPVPTPTVTKPTHGAAPTPPHKSGSAKQG
jgi:hypothetical protein